MLPASASTVVACWNVKESQLTISLTGKPVLCNVAGFYFQLEVGTVASAGLLFSSTPVVLHIQPGQLQEPGEDDI